MLQFDHSNLAHVYIYIHTCLRPIGLIHILKTMLTLRLSLFIISWWHNAHDHLSYFPLTQYIPTMVVPLIFFFLCSPASSENTHIFNNLWHSDAWDGYPPRPKCEVAKFRAVHYYTPGNFGCPKQHKQPHFKKGYLLHGIINYVYAYIYRYTWWTLASLCDPPNSSILLVERNFLDIPIASTYGIFT